MAEKIDVNRADVETLASLPGIGLKRATQIVEYRTAVHPFEELIELAAVPGISERMVREWAGLLTVNGDGPPETPETAEYEPPRTEETSLPESLPADEQPTAEPEAAPLPVEAEEEEPPVVVTMLENRSERPQPDEAPLFEQEAETAAVISRPAVIERQVVETVQRRHIHFWQQFLGVALGAVGGSLLTLLLLYLLNGTLRFSSESRTADLQLQLDEQSSAIRQSQSSLAEEMGGLSGQVAELDNELSESGRAIAVVGENVALLEQETAAINEKLAEINLATEKFDTFLTGLRDLLFALQGAPVPTATAVLSDTTPLTSTVTPSGTAEIPQTTPTPTAAAPEAGEATRTPRPTATPLIESGN